MMRRKIWFILGLFFIFLPSALMAQEMMHGKWWLNKALTEELQLTDAERQNLEEKYTESRRRMIDIKSEVERQRLELDIVLDRQDADRQQILEQYTRLEDARKELSKARFGLLIEVREIIGAERFQSLKEMHRDRARSKKDRRSFQKGRY